MGAPAGAYRSQSLYAKNAAGTAIIQHLFAILHVSKAVMLARFYLDDIFIHKMSDGTDGVIGIVRSNSSNYQFHAPARLGCFREQYFGAFCNDGGLNTLGIAYNAAFNAVTVGNIKLYGEFLSAWYVNTTDYGFLYKIDNGSWGSVGYNALAQQASITQEHTISPMALISAGQTIYLKLFITNPEGTYETVQISAVIQAKTISAMYTNGWPSQANNPVTVYTETNFNEAFYGDSQLVNKAPDGYYVFDGYWYEQSGGIVVAQNEASSGNWPIGDPGNPAVESFYWEGYSSVSAQDAINDIPGPSFGTVYHNAADNKWYDNYNQSTQVFSTVVTDGYYAKDSNNVKWFVDGIEEMIIG